MITYLEVNNDGEAVCAFVVTNCTINDGSVFGAEACARGVGTIKIRENGQLYGALRLHDKPEQAWERAAQAALENGEGIRVRRVRVDGRGYGGGHNTAVREGWPVTYPSAEPSAVLWWDDTEEGAWTGLRPATVSLIPVE